MIEGKSLQTIPLGFRERTLANAKLAGRLGLRFAKRSMKGRAADQTDGAEALRTATALLEQLGPLKGIAMKIGQMASYMPGALPEPAQQLLSQLQSQSTPMAFERVVEVVEQSFGEPLHALFEEFDPKPIAAASIGQVHRARFRGRQVAVKVQYPRIEEALRSDLKLGNVLIRMMMMGTGDGAALADELRVRMLEECDYLLEAKRQTVFRQLYKKIPGCHVPEVIHERCRRQVLTTEYVSALSFQEFAASASQAAKNKAGVAIFRACFQTLFESAVYNGDPHPGNYLFSPEGDVTFLDFGCAREFSREFIDDWKPVEQAMMAGDKARMFARFPQMGLIANEKKFDWEAHWDMMNYTCRAYTATEPFTFSQAYVAESYDVMIFKNPNVRAMRTPPEWLLLNRVHWGLNSVLALLHATAHWGTHWLHAINSVTSPVTFDASPDDMITAGQLLTPSNEMRSAP